MWLSFRDKLKQEIEKGLPGESAHLPMSPLNRLPSSIAITQTENYRFSAVACILHPRGNSLEIVLIERPTYDGAHSGQIAFPGGKMEESDPNDEFTARRECFEEIGIELKDEHYLGKLTDVFIPISSFVMHPHLYFVENLPEFNPDIREVASILCVDFFKNINEQNIERKDLPTQQKFVLKNVPGFLVKDKFVWGATALVLNELRELLKRISLS